MSSQTPRMPIYETRAVVYQNTIPPPPPRTAAYSAPHRDHVGSSPSLSVIPVVHSLSHQSTPLSAVSHQNPFSSTISTPVVPFSGSASSGSSPMAARTAHNFSVPYDPRDWASGDVRANQARRAQERHPEDGLASPPPPYSPQSTAEHQSEGSIANAASAADPLGTANARNISAAHGSPSITQRPKPRHVNTLPVSNRHSIHLVYPLPPPPPPVNGGNRHVSHSQIAGIQNGYNSRDASPGPQPQPPAARRAVSANAGISAADYMPSRSSSSHRGWHPGMPLPGPPPGPPPPSTSRSQSMSDPRERSGSSSAAAGPSASRLSRYATHSTDLEPIPPTPAGWDDSHPMPSNSPQPLSINTNVQHSLPHTQMNVLGSASITQTPGPILTRSPAVRDASAKGLRERRAQSRNSRVISASELGDLSVQTDAWNDTHIRPGPSSGRSTVGPPSAGRLPSGRLTGPSPLGNILADSTGITDSPTETATPPFSPQPQTIAHEQISKPDSLHPKSLPTPPLSHKAPLSAGVKTPSKESLSTAAVEGTDAFAQSAIRRHNEFLEKERKARTDLERLEAFADFVLNEAQIRQQRYKSAIQSGDFDAQSLRDKLFMPSSQQTSASASTERRTTEARTTAMTSNASQPRPDSYWKDYQPALSPIASMDYDEMSSRGRAPSRWWESQTGSQTGDRDTRVKRSKRESKYMGLSKEFLMAHSPSEESSTPNATSYFTSGDMYPAEKANPDTFGFYDEHDLRPSPVISSKAPETPHLLDISRFITLPPPYPRHYPAVNNNHPELAEYRTTVRTLSDLDEIRTRKSRQKLNVEALQIDLQRRLTEGRRAFRANIQAQIEDGSITYAEAAEAEEAQKLSEMGMQKQSLQAEFDTLQDVVINPLHDILNGRITKLDASILKLQDELRSDARHQDPDRPQEEGDETPELLEKLTQLKWLFDTREQIHKECFEILSERNNKYMSIVLLPYKLNKNTEKIRETELFFERDTQTRFVTHCSEAVRRHEEFLKIIEEHVRRGIELQSSAFWDIAPGLLDLLQKLPDDLRQLPGLQIPPKEYDENPSYHKHPQQYLYSLLSHAEKSTYQFIEAQVNLHCLLHEVKSGRLAARYRWMHAQEAMTGSHYDGIQDSQDQEETNLTADLKQKASLIEEQWLEALGSQLQGTRERVKTLLQHDDAWEEIAHDDA